MKLLQLTFIILLILSCSEKKQAEYTPWGELITDSITPQAAGTYTIQDIIGNGEMIMLTMSGPDLTTTITDAEWERSTGCANVWQRSSECR